MSSRATIVLLEDIINSIGCIEQYIEGYNVHSFKADRRTLDATVRNLEIIGEAAKLLPEDFKQRHPTIAWKQIIGLRNVVIHGYFRVDVNILWQIITENLPGLKTDIESALDQLNETTSDDRQEK